MTPLFAVDLQIGDSAPLIAGSMQDGTTWKLADLAGKKVVILAFYPKANNIDSVRYMSGLRDRYLELAQKNVAIVGVSTDQIAAQAGFAKEYQIAFPLLSDPQGEIVDSYAARATVGVDDIKLREARYITFYIGLDGKISDIVDTKSVAAQLAQIPVSLKKAGIE